jgi:thioredoxin-related protein
MKRVLIFFLLLVLVAGCRQEKTFRLEGTYSVKEHNYIYIKRIDVDTPVLLDSAKIKKNGMFRMKIEATEPDFYQVGFNEKDFITLLAEPGEKISLIFEEDNLSGKYTVKGSPGSAQIKMLDQRLAITKRKLDSLKVEYESVMKDPGIKEKGAILEEAFANVLKDQRKYNIEFIIQNLSSMASVVAVYQKIDENTFVLYEPRDLQYLKLVSDTLSKYYPNSRHTRALTANFEKEMNEMYKSRLQKMAEEMPETRLDPELTDISGKRIKLSSIKNRYVLLTFWSVMSKECIAENIQLKEFYRLYNKKGFEIYQVNLDENEEAWKNAVRFDELPWISVREDDPAQPRVSRLYNVRSLPTNYLYDKNGTIIASNIHGRVLKIKLEQLFGK